jgi:uncharacterized caspase-like protein
MSTHSRHLWSVGDGMSTHSRHLWSVSVGINNYSDPRISPLRYAVADARAVHEAIVRTFDSTPEQSVILTDEQATMREFRSAIGDRLARVADVDDIVFIFFAGHGSPESARELDSVSRYLVMHDSDYDSIFATGVDLERDFVRLLERIRARQIVVFLDSCFSGRAGGRTFEGSTLTQRRHETRLPAVDLNQLELGEGRVVVSACDDWQVAREDSELEHGVFTFHLLKTLMQEATEEPTISVLRLYDEVATAVARQTVGQQHPILIGRARLFHFPRLK